MKRGLAICVSAQYLTSEKFETGWFASICSLTSRSTTCANLCINTVQQNSFNLTHWEFQPGSVCVGLSFFIRVYFPQDCSTSIQTWFEPFYNAADNRGSTLYFGHSRTCRGFLSPAVAHFHIWIQTHHLLPSWNLCGYWFGPCPLPPGRRRYRWTRPRREATRGSAAACAVSGSPWPTTSWASSSSWRGCLEGSSSTTCSSTREPLSSSSAWSGGCCGTLGTSTCRPRSWRTTWEWWSWRTADWAGWWGTCQSASPAGSGSLSGGRATLAKSPLQDTPTLQTPVWRWCSPQCDIPSHGKTVLHRRDGTQPSAAWRRSHRDTHLAFLFLIVPLCFPRTGND